MTTLKAPAHLSREAKKLWRSICEEWAIDPHGAVILRLALEAFDRVNEARGIIEEEGLVITTVGTGAKHQHPAVQIEREARAQMLQAWRQLGLDIEPPGPIGRPPGR